MRTITPNDCCIFFSSLISYMKIMESELNLGDSLQGVKQFFSTMINVQKFLNEQLEKGKGMDMIILTV